MHNEFTAVFERDADWYIAYSPEIPGANRQGPLHSSSRFAEKRASGEYHSLWTNPRTGAVEAVPSHTQIPNKCGSMLEHQFIVPDLPERAGEALVR